MVTEDLTTYTVAGAEAEKISTTATRATWTSLDRSDEAYCYKSHGADHFDLASGLTHDLDFHVTDRDVAAGALSTLVQIWVLANAVDDLEALKTGNENFLTLIFRPEVLEKDELNKLNIVEWKNDAREAQDISGDILDMGDTVYIRIVISGSSCNVGIYSTTALRDAGDGTDGDIDNIGITLSAANLKFEYLYAVQSRDNFTSESTGYIENLDINEAVAETPTGSGAITRPRPKPRPQIRKRRKTRMQRRRQLPLPLLKAVKEYLELKQGKDS